MCFLMSVVPGVVCEARGEFVVEAATSGAIEIVEELSIGLIERNVPFFLNGDCDRRRLLLLLLRERGVGDQEADCEISDSGAVNPRLETWNENGRDNHLYGVVCDDRKRGGGVKVGDDGDAETFRLLRRGEDEGDSSFRSARDLHGDEPCR